MRFLPEYDNLLLAHDDRRHVLPGGGADYRAPAGSGGWRGSVLVDGTIAALWRLTLRDAAATLRIETKGSLTKQARAEVGEEGERLIGFLAPEAGARAIEVVPR